MEQEITNIDEAYDYLYHVNVGQAEYNEEKMTLARSFFTEKELQDMNLTPDVSINSCFNCICKRCNIE